MKTPFYLLLIFLGIGISCKNKSPKTGESVEMKASSADTLATEENLALEGKYLKMLDPIQYMKKEDPTMYWFIVSWLNTAYGTPDWKGYEKEDWRTKTKERGIDCSGFSRVMQDKIFNKQIRGGSQGLLDNYCSPRAKNDLTLGDLVFFKAPGSDTNRIVHVGVYLKDDFFVHATSTRSAAEGFGLMINSLTEDRWSGTFVAGGAVKS